MGGACRIPSAASPSGCWEGTRRPWRSWTGSRKAGCCALAVPLPGNPIGATFELRSPEEAPVLAARLVTGTALDAPLPPIALRLATTRGTNALLERKGAATALFITRGFADLTVIGTQARPDLFALEIRAAAPLYREVVEVPERLAADGSVLPAAGCRGAAETARRLLAEGFESAAVALMHSYRNPGTRRSWRATAERGLSPRLALLAARAPHQAAAPGGDGGSGRLSLAHPGALPVGCGQGPGAGLATRHDELRRPRAGELVPRQGRPPLRPRRGCGGGGAGRAEHRLRAGDCLRHGRHEHGRGPLGRRLRVPLRAHAWATRIWWRRPSPSRAWRRAAAPSARSTARS